MSGKKSILYLLLAFVMIVQLQPGISAAVQNTSSMDMEADTSMSRAMFATILYRMAGSLKTGGVSSFSDVAQDKWYTKAVIWATEKGIVTGYDSGLFGINDPVTREQIAIMLWRYCGKPVVSDEALSFSDAANISSNAVKAVAWATSIGAIKIKPGTRFDPKGNVTRAEAAAILCNYLNIEYSTLVTQYKATSTPQYKPTPTPPVDGGMTNITITVGSSVFSAKLYDNDATRALLAQLPMTVNMSELNGNEKYYYLPNKLPADSQRIGSIKTGELMLYGSDCLVLFYESFSSSYNYTKLGYIEDVSKLATALGSGNVKVSFAVNK